MKSFQARKVLSVPRNLTSSLKPPLHKRWANHFYPPSLQIYSTLNLPPGDSFAKRTLNCSFVHTPNFKRVERDNGKRLIAHHFLSEHTYHVELGSLAKSTETNWQPMRTSYAASPRNTLRTRRESIICTPHEHSRAFSPSLIGLFPVKLITALHKQRKFRSCRGCHSIWALCHPCSKAPSNAPPRRSRI